ncbi:snRNA-activating protein complex subunit [Sesamum alatum]|uniref:snRNA-activating protein complex subunit n=1 Tax=Sesamum alatum TaxID=300844 RepID=A0AAE1YQG2_9LAMI|nr:snRNA-activating protein complex subunit [Sesamum alatum]
MLMGHDEGGEDHHISIPLGGPIYVRDMVGPLIRVPDFENSVFQELQSLKEELSGDSLETCDEEILVDELKIIGEDELVNRAFEEAFKEGELAIDASRVTEEHLSPRKTDDNGASGLEHGGLHNSDQDMKAIVPSDSSNVLPLRSCRDKKSNKNPSGKRKKRRHERGEDNSFDESYIAKVEELARIKQKQEEQKAAVRLHSFDSSKVPGSGAMTKADKIRSLKSASVSTKVRASTTRDNVPVQFPEAGPMFLRFTITGKHGRQFLTEVRDKIYCLTDEIMKKAGHNDPSGYFLIEDVFYNDMRDCSAMDYSKPILDWLENSKNDALEKWEFIVSGELQQKQKALLGSQSKQQLPRLKSAHMQTTRFCDIRFRLGAGYLYCHQGDCKHVIVIRDLRLIHPEDVQNRAAYPLLTLQQKFRYRKCSVCKIYRAAKMTVDDKWALSNPSYFCDVLVGQTGKACRRPRPDGGHAGETELDSLGQTNRRPTECCAHGRGDGRGDGRAGKTRTQQTWRTGNRGTTQAWPADKRHARCALDGEQTSARARRSSQHTTTSSDKDVQCRLARRSRTASAMRTTGW